MQQQFTATLAQHWIWQNAIPIAAVQDKLTAGLCLCTHACEGALVVQVCSAATVVTPVDTNIVYCSTALGKMYSPIFSAAMQGLNGRQQSINQFTFLVFRTHQGSQQTITGKTTYTKH